MEITLNQISKKFKNTVVLDSVSLHICSGKIYGVVGYNGSGKTVLLKCICGLLLVDNGEIIIDGKKNNGAMLENAGIIIEEPAFLENETGKKNLELLYMIRNKKDDKKILEVMKQVGLDASSNKKVKNYSLGMRQRLAIAQAIMENPEILLLDEPMNGLDKQGVDDIRNLLFEMKNEGKAIVLASHNQEDIRILCDYVYEMDHGKIKYLQESEGHRMA